MNTTTSTVTEREPSVVIGLVTTAVAAVLALLVAFGIDVTAEQQVAILGVIAGVGPLLAGILIRRKVTPDARVVEHLDAVDAVVAGPANERIPTGVVVRDLDPRGPPAVG